MASSPAAGPSPGFTGRIYFYQKHNKETGYLSQWHQSEFKDEERFPGLSFPTAEHYMMYAKAALFGDDEAARQIAAVPGSRPSTARQLGRRVEGFDTAKWDREKEAIVLRGNYLKFTAAGAGTIRRRLLRTHGYELVEANPADNVWGVGLDAEDAESGRFRWGQNLLGMILMAVRDVLAQAHAEEASSSAVEVPDSPLKDDRETADKAAENADVDANGSVVDGKDGGLIEGVEGSAPLHPDNPTKDELELSGKEAEREGEGTSLDAPRDKPRHGQTEIPNSDDIGSEFAAASPAASLPALAKKAPRATKRKAAPTAGQVGGAKRGAAGVRSTRRRKKSNSPLLQLP